MITLAEHDPDSLAAELRAMGHNAQHAGMILRRYYEHSGELPVERMPILRSLRLELSRGERRLRSRVLSRHEAADGTTKLLIAFDRDSAACEAVLMPSHRPDRAAGCVSSQVGCAMGCDFCASTKRGLTRDLTCGEIVEQFLRLRAVATQRGRRLASLVFMGMGEPMHNLEQVIPALLRIADPSMGALGWRHVTVSTVGIVPGIERLADEDLGVHLALSLHAPDDATRQMLVPAGKRYPVADILAAARRYQERSGRITTIEYCLLAGVNDDDSQARELVRLIGDWRAHVNLIPFNPIGPGLSGRVYERPTPARVARFTEVLRSAGVVTHIRRPRGDDVDAACGQLRERQLLVTFPRETPCPNSP